LFCSFYTIILSTMLYCPNPSCSQNLRKTKRLFPSVKSFSHHLQQSPECKAFVLEQTAGSAPPMQAASKRASFSSTNQLFKKQRLRLNPTFTQQHHTNNTITHNIEDQPLNDDDVSLSNHNAAQSGSLTNDNLVASEESNGLKNLLATMFLLTLLSHLLKVLITHVSPPASNVLHL